MPRSSKVVSEDADYALVSVVLFKKVLDDFKAAARSKGYQVGPPITHSCGCVGRWRTRQRSTMQIGAHRLVWCIRLALHAGFLHVYTHVPHFKHVVPIRACMSFMCKAQAHGTCVLAHGYAV